MPIEFRCTQCNKLLRTADDTAGKQAKCPECGTVLTIPAAPAAAPPPQPQPGAAPAGAAPPGDPENPYQSPSPFAAEGPTQTPGGLTRNILDFGDIFSRTWAIFKMQWGMCLGVVIVVGLINFFVNLLVGFATGMMGAAAGDEAVAIVFSLVGNLITTCFSIWIGIGQALIFLRIARGQPTSLGEIFTGGPYFITVLLASLLFGLIVIVGYVLCIVPGVILALMFSQYYYLIIDRNAGVMDSLNISKDLMDGNKLTLFLIGLVAGIVGALVIVGTCFVGLLVVAPYLTLLAPVIYLAITGQPTADRLQGGMPMQPAGPTA